MLISALYTVLAIASGLVAAKLGYRLGEALSEKAALTVAFPFIVVMCGISVTHDDLSDPLKVCMLAFLGFSGALCVSASFKS